MPGPYPNDQGNPAGAIPVYIAGGAAGSAVNPVPPNAPPATLAAAGVWSSGVISAAGFNKLAAAATLTQTGTLTIQRYIDAAGTVPLGAAITQAMTASTPATAWVNDGQPAASWQVTVTNTSGSTGTLSGVVLLEQV